MLQCLVVAVRPLRVEELAEVLAFDFSAEGVPKLNPAWRCEDQEEAVMSACSSLVVVIKDGDSRIVQFSHFSVKEFLTSDRLAESAGGRDVSYYYIPLVIAHTILAQACLGVLLQLDDHVDRDKIKDFPLAKYAAKHWINHAQVENVSSHIKDGMECLFDTNKPHFAAWLWIYNEDRDGRSMSTMSPEKPEAAPLYYASLLGLRDLTAHLLAEHPEDVNARGGSEQTALHACAYHGHVDIFSLLVHHFPNLDIRGFDGTPLHRASYKGHLEIGRRLLDCGANVNAKESCDWTPLYIVAVNGHLEFARMLLERGASINAPTISSKTPLYAASEEGHPEVVRLLLEHGANVSARNVLGRTPSDVASLRGRREIVQILSEYRTTSTE